MISPAALYVAGNADFTRWMPGAGIAVTVSSAGGLVTASSLGVVPVAVAALVTWPASTSAWVAVYVAVQVAVSPVAIVDGVHGMGPAMRSSVTCTPCRVKNFVLVTV